jgi:hypothetical protein
MRPVQVVDFECFDPTAPGRELVCVAIRKSANCTQRPGEAALWADGGYGPDAGES